MSSLVWPRAYCVAITIRNCIYVIGGRAPPGEVERMDFWCPGVWETVTGPPQWRSVGSSAVALCGQIFIFGGWNKQGPAVGKSAVKFNPETMQWVDLPDLPADYEYFGQAVTMDGAVYLVGGSP